MTNIELSAQLIERMRELQLTLASAESCTGGNIAHCITEVPGASDVFNGAVVAYSNRVKQLVLGVSEATLERYGAVSEETVGEMLSGVVDTIGSDCAVATSGIAGPGGGTAHKPVGMVCIGAVMHDRKIVSTYHFKGSRAEIIDRSTYQALMMIAGLLPQK